MKLQLTLASVGAKTVPLTNDKRSFHSPIKILICFLPKSRPKIDEMVSPISARGRLNLRT